MTTLVGPWQGSSPRARIEIDYNLSFNSEHTLAYIDPTVVLATEHSIVDSYNSWTVWGSLGSFSGSNVVYNHANSGGRTGFKSLTGWIGPSGADVGARVTGLEAPAATIEATLHIDPGPLAPYINGQCNPYNIVATSFSVSFTGIGNGGNLVDAQLQINTSQSESGAVTITKGSYGDIYVPNLTRRTIYYYRVRLSNSTYGWGPWSSWQSITTLMTAPSVATGYSATSITQTGAQTTGVTVADNGGQPLSDIRVVINTSASLSGATTITRGSYGDIIFANLLPGTTYYFAVATYNGYAWSVDGAWVSFTTLPGALVRDGGIWKNAIPYVKNAGVWVPATRYIKSNGVWK